MDQPSGKPVALARELRGILERRRTGVLSLEGPWPGPLRLLLVSGDIYLEPGDAPVRGEEGAAEGSEDAPTAALARRLARATSWELREGVAGISSDLEGPFATAPVAMDLAVAGCGEFELLKQLGGEEAGYRPSKLARGGGDLPQLSPREAFLLSRLVGTASVREIVRDSRLEREEAFGILCRLQAAALIEREERAAGGEGRDEASAELIRRFEERVADSLDRKPLALEREEHRQRLGELLGRFGEMTHFELLGVDLAATPEEVYDAFLELARSVHPEHAEALGLRGREGGLRLLFERATEAYLTLSDRDRRRAYLGRVGTTGARRVVREGGAARQGEQRELAESLYRRARSLAQHEEFHFAIELLHQAIRADPRADYYALLGECQARNPSWLDRAAGSYARAAELDPADAGLRVELGQIYERMGSFGRAVREYRVALEILPSETRAMAGLRRIETRHQAPAGTWSRALAALRRLVGRPPEV